MIPDSVFVRSNNEYMLYTGEVWIAQHTVLVGELSQSENGTRPRALIQNRHTGELISA